VADFAPVARVAKFQFALVVGPAVPASVKTLADFANWCKANPARANYGSAGEGTMAHFAGFMVAQAAGFSMTHVAYKGSAPAVQDVLGGHIAASMNILSEIIPFVADGRLRALTTTGPVPSPNLPGVPSMRQLGFGNATAEEYFAIFAPRGTPASTISRLSQAVASAVQVPAVVESFAKLGFEAAHADSAALAAMIKTDMERWGPVVRATGFTAN
jgi:tripartite-type tricarboxylate transporter receptor subunit TctC